MDPVFTRGNYRFHVDFLVKQNSRIRQIIDAHGYPPFWHRSAGYDGLVRIILEQQVSLASAHGVFKKLETDANGITPENIIQLTDQDLKSCGLTRQKSRYVRVLAREIQDNGLDLSELAQKSNDQIKARLTSVTGIGDWSADVYLLMCLNRANIFPIGDLALRKAMVHLGFSEQNDSKATMGKIALQFTPYQSIFAMILWHWYIIWRKVKMP